jgi:tRNA U34 5-methylaminomethyl-2-thiouridine-forming methyltransferase MnmC
MSEPDLFIELSGDGSHTLRSAQFNTHYHSIHGAITESQVVFINACLRFLHEKGIQEVKVFEMGFGTGLNAIMSLQFATANNFTIDYHTIEAYPIPLEIASKLNVGKHLGLEDVFENLHTCQWNELQVISPNFSFTKYQGLVEDYDLPSDCDGIFFDAFGPTDQPYLWETTILEKMHRILRQNGILTTYCAQGNFRRNLIGCGFEVERLPGPPHKRQIIRATKK